MNSVYIIFIVGVLFLSIQTLFNYSVIKTLIISIIMVSLYLYTFRNKNEIKR